LEKKKIVWIFSNICPVALQLISPALILLTFVQLYVNMSNLELEPLNIVGSFMPTITNPATAASATKQTNGSLDFDIVGMLNAMFPVQFWSSVFKFYAWWVCANVGVFVTVASALGRVLGPEILPVE
jgi:hypothetical protein